MRICRGCGQKEPYNEYAWYCSFDCRHEAQRRREGKVRKVRCVNCGHYLPYPQTKCARECFRGYVYGGARATAEYRVWASMISRCSNPNATGWKHYGGRGIKVCARWRYSYTYFRLDMGPRPSSGHSIDRIDVNGNYEPGNCRWATWKQQANNRRKRAA